MLLRAAAQDAYRPAREFFHESRAGLFMRLMQPMPGAKVLDLGGGSGSLVARIARRLPIEVTVADPEPTIRQARRYGFQTCTVEPGAPLPFADDSFDIVFCNSVIEHATVWQNLPGPGLGNSWETCALIAQARFADEIRRVGRTYFVQSPHADFPLDAHLWLPLTNWLPHSWTEPLVRFTDRFWIKTCGVADWHLLRTAQMKALFPDGRVHVERVLGLPKSIIAFKSLPG